MMSKNNQVNRTPKAKEKLGFSLAPGEDNIEVPPNCFFFCKQEELISKLNENIEEGIGDILELDTLPHPMI